MEKQQVVAPEVAEAEFERFTEAMDLDVDPQGMDDEDKKGFIDCRRKVVNAIVEGRLVIDEKGQPVFTPSEGGSITFREPRGSALMAMDSKKKGHDFSKLYATMAETTEQPITRFSKMANRDLKVCTAVMTLFLA